MPAAPHLARLRRLLAHALLACAALAASALHAQGLEATFNSPGDIPLTVPSYTASGTATLSLGFAPTPGTNLTLIKNTGLPFIEGQFTNLPNGSTVILSYAGTPYPFIAWYYGGAGNNDLVLLWPYTGLASWGRNSNGQLGDNSTMNRQVPVGVVQGGVLQGKTIVQVVCSGEHSLALCSDGTVAAWGANNSGQLGDNSMTVRSAPVSVNVEAGTSALAGKSVVAISAGISHSLALCSDGTAVAWGYNAYGQLGDNSTTNRHVPVAVNVADGTSVLAGKAVVSIAMGGYHSLALCSDGTVVAWGYNAYGQLGDNSTTNRHVPVAVNVADGTSALAGKAVVSIAMGAYHSLALCSDGTAAAFGYNTYGQLGDNSTTNRPVPVAVNTAAGTSALAGKTVLALSSGSLHSLALCNDGTVVCWGWNLKGQLGDSSTTNRAAPVAVNTEGASAIIGKSVTAIAAGDVHSLALCHDGIMVAWGYNNAGQLGDNSTTDRLVPVAVNTAAGTSVLAGSRVSQMSIGAGASHSSAIHGEPFTPLLPTVTPNAANLALNATTLTISGTNFDPSSPGNNTVVFTPAGIGTVTSATSTSLIVSVSGLNPGALHAVVTANTRSSGAFIQVATVIAPTPEIAVTGNGTGIFHGDTTPSTTDLTDFGKVALPHAKVNTFNIANVGNVPLSLTGTPLVTLSGSGAAAFKVTLDPADTVAAVSSTRFAVTFDPSFPGLYMATVAIQSDAANHPSFTFNISGLGALSTELKQSITFAPPTTIYIGQSPLSLSAYASSGLPVTLSVVPTGTTAAGATILSNALRFTGTGTVKVQAVQAGGGLYAGATPVVKTITVKAIPTVLTLLRLTQPYTGTPRPISTLGSKDTLIIHYKIGAAFDRTAPVNAGSYPVQATDSTGTKTGTLVIAKAPLFVTPANQRKFAGQDNPPLTLSYSGLINGEQISVVTAAPTMKTTATKTSVGGVYPITASGGVVSGNYAFIYKQGVLVVDSFAGSYESLLMNGGEIIGRLALTVSAANTSFTGKLYCANDKVAIPVTGALVIHPEAESAAGNTAFIANGIVYQLSITLHIGGLTVNIARAGSPNTSTSQGRRVLALAAGQTVTYSGAHTAVLEPAAPAANGVPAGAGWATAVVSTKGVMTLAGRLGDGTSFTTTLLPDDASDPTYRLWLQPYKTGAATRLQSYLGRAFTLLPHPALAGRRYVESAALTWAKAGLTTDSSYPAGFGPVSTVLMLDPWLPPATGIPLASRLGLTNSSFQVLHSDTGSTLNGNLPTRAGLSATNAVSVTTPTANTTKWKATLVPATGLFSGSFELADTTPKPRAVTFTGVLRQPATAPDALIGDGHYLLPPLTGTAKTTGEVMLKRP